MAKRYAFLQQGDGASYDWANDHIFVKVGAQDTGGAYTLVEDNFKSTFMLGLHVHRQHAETFFILDGSVDFHVDGDWVTAGPGACLHVPPGTPHGAKLSEGCSNARSLMIFQPSGFDKFLKILSQMDDADFADEAKMTALNERFDIHNIGPLPPR